MDDPVICQDIAELQFANDPEIIIPEYTVSEQLPKINSTKILFQVQTNTLHTYIVLGYDLLRYLDIRIYSDTFHRKFLFPF